MSRRVGAIRSQPLFFGRDKSRFVEAVIGAAPHVMPLGQAPHLLKRPDSAFEHVHDGGRLLCRNFHAKRFAEHLGHVLDRFYRLRHGQGGTCGIRSHRFAPHVLRDVVHELDGRCFRRRRVEVERVRKRVCLDVWLCVCRKTAKSSSANGKSENRFLEKCNHILKIYF